jgi:Protein of unknown function (DUF2934)
MQDLDQAIREYAYHLWVADGCRDGNADTHWLVAQREVLSTSLGQIGRVTVDEAQGPTGASDKKSSRKPRAVSKSKAKRRAA